MSRTITGAAIQMDANPTPTAERLNRATVLVQASAERGADIVVLPELFNTGYSYSPQMHSRVESLDGQTVAWMRDIAARTGIHLAGSLLLFDRMDIVNAMLLVAPDGDLWRYDKCYPWCWERSCFRPGNTLAIADTRLGKLGMLVCWDTAHLHLWAAYAGKIDMLLISSCPPDGTNPIYSFDTRSPLTLAELGPVGKRIQNTGSTLFGAMINEQTAWLGVPAICTVATGRITTPIPRGQATLVSYLPAAPWLFPYLAEAHSMSMSCDMIPGCKVLDSRGTPCAELTNQTGDDFVTATVSLTHAPLQPVDPQPPSRLPRIAYIISDIIIPRLMTSCYRQSRLNANSPGIQQ